MTPALHAVACGTASHWIVKKTDWPKWVAFAVPVAIGFAKEFWVDENPCEKDIIGNVIGAGAGAWITPNLEFGKQDDNFFIRWKVRM